MGAKGGDTLDVRSNVSEASAIKNAYSENSSQFNDFLRGYAKVYYGERVHHLYKLLNRCPRLPERAFFLRSVSEEEFLPHNLGVAPGGALRTPEVGRGYFNATFVSTTVNPPQSYVENSLSDFYTAPLFGGGVGCCIYVITCPAGLPVLPLFLAEDDVFPTEQEVLLPPGLFLFYQGERSLILDEVETRVHFYEARLPPEWLVAEAAKTATAQETRETKAKTARFVKSLKDRARAGVAAARA